MGAQTAGHVEQGKEQAKQVLPKGGTSRLARRERIAGYLFLSPTIILFFVFIAGPLLGAIALSFFEWDMFSDPKWVGLDNFRNLANDMAARTAIRNTFMFTFWSVVLHLGPGLLLALVVNRDMPYSLNYFLRTAYFFPLLVSWAAVSGATNAGAVHFAPSGPDNTLVTLHLEYEPEGLVEKAGDALRIVERQAEKDVEAFKTFIEGRTTPTGAWRGDVEGATAGAPGVESATSHGDSGKAGMSKTAMAAGAAAVAAGAAAVAAKRSGSDEDSTESMESVETVDSPALATPVVPVRDEDTFVSEPVVAEAVIVEEDPPTDPRTGI